MFKLLEFNSVNFINIREEVFFDIIDIKDLPLETLSFIDCSNLPDYIWKVLSEVKS